MFVLKVKDICTNKILLVILLVKKGYGLVSARSQPYRTRPEAERRYQAVSLFYKGDN